MNKQRARQRAWRALSKHQRSLLISYRPDAFEQDETLKRDTLAELEQAFGPRHLPHSAALAAEGEAETLDFTNGADSYYAATYDEIGRAIGVSTPRAREILERALTKLRDVSNAASWLLREYHYGETASTAWHRREAHRFARASFEELASEQTDPKR